MYACLAIIMRVILDNAILKRFIIWHSERSTKQLHGLDKFGHTLFPVLQYVLHLFHGQLQHLCVLHLGMKLRKETR